MNHVEFFKCRHEPYRSVENKMINSIEINNFKCHKEIMIDKCRRINIIVGENGCGKTALLEAIFLALGRSPELPLRFRRQRGFQDHYTGSLRGVEEAIWIDYFYLRDSKQEISIKLNGTGPEARSVRIFKGPLTRVISLPDAIDDFSNTDLKGMQIIWTDADGNDYRSAIKVTKNGIEFPESLEDVPDFFFYPSGILPNSVEVAERFSRLSRRGMDDNFKKIFTKEYNWIEDLSIEVEAGAPGVYATIRGSKDKLPLANISGGINRILSIMLAVCSRSQSVVLADEVENGIYFKHQSRLWRGLIDLTRDNNGQIFLSTHSEEWLRALVDAADEKTDDIALWRLEREEGSVSPVVHQFAGSKVLNGILAGEVR